MTELTTKHGLRRRFLRILPVLPVIVAIAVVIALVKTRSVPVKKPAGETGRPMRVIAVPVTAFTPRALGYGVAVPARVWQAVAEVKGTIISVHPRLESGALVDAEALLLKIDPADYELAVAQRQAGIAETRAKLDELAEEERSKKASLEIERRSLAFARQSLERLQLLRRQNAVAADVVDRDERGVLLQEQAVQQLENALAQIPARRAALAAALAVHEANLKQAKLDLARTEVRAPFACRIGETRIGTGQYVNAGQALFEAHGTSTVEVEAKFRPEQLRNLLPPEKRRQFQAGMSMEAMRKLFDLKVTVRLRSGDWEASWPARFDRIRESVDPRTRAINVVAVVDDPYGQIVPGVRPALMQGMHCEMELQAPPRPGTVVLPRGTVWNETVYLADTENRLRRRPVRIAFAQDDLMVIEAGLEGGETVIVSDPAPAIEGMRIEPVTDDDLRARLIGQAENRREATP
ncbi:MAG: efflux RND transporter periplasmic adaptor subunit [Lentisphaeria bacterium]|nr:efflux RND transporter periplasmic adaptor subunit [Lentisphaeria bacterium]